MLVSAITSLVTKNCTNEKGLNDGHAFSKNTSYDKKNYFGAKKENTQLVKEDLFHQIALWKNFCENQIITDEFVKETFNYLA